MTNDTRPSWDEYFIEMAKLVGTRGTCDRGHAGTVITKDNRVLTTGYAGAPSGLPHCDEVGHEIHEVTTADGTKSKHCIRTTHSEQNAIVQAARIGVSIEGGTLYTKFEPCYICAKMIVNSGIKRVVCVKRYHAAERSREIFKQAGISLEVIMNEEEEYDNK